jgi:two-component system, chemotaxis family, protein-glutamate methylesterase/glutaminase
MVTERKVRVLIVEDTLVGQSLLKGLLADDPIFEVIGIAQNGKEAVEFVAKYFPDVVSMDIFMPVMDGVEATRLIMRITPLPIVIVSSFYSASEVKMSFSILEAGALTILPRPFGPGHPQYNQTARNYRNTLKMMSQVKVGPRRASVTPAKVAPARSSGTSAVITGGHLHSEQSPGASSTCKVIAIGASAGGPQAIQVILEGLDAKLPVPVLIVQHIDPHFADGYCDWLNATSKIPVHIASDGEKMLAGHAYLPPGDHHLGVQHEGVITISKNPPEKGLRPAVSFLFRQVNAVYRKNSICILLSGMGTDGAKEMKELRDTGALTIAQDTQSALVHGMPGEAIRLGGATLILTPEAIVEEINKIGKL